MDWEIARWAKLRGPGSTAVTELLGISGLQDALRLSFKNSRELNAIIDEQLPSRRPRFQQLQTEIEGEVFDMYFRDVIECIRALFSDRSFAPYLVFAPERHYTDETRENRLYHDMHTGKWWWDTQEKLEAEKPGATIIPVIIASDKTQVTLFGGKTMYPCYLTIGNIPKELRRKVSQQAQILFAYLPATRLEHITNKAARRRILANIFHSALRVILQPLHDAGRNGLTMASGDGVSRRVHPLFATHVGDYLEYIAVACCKMGDCPRCQVPPAELGQFDMDYPLRNLGVILDALATYDTDRDAFVEACRKAGIKPTARPYWEGLPHTNVFKSIPPDILHQLYQGLIKHLIAWIKSAYSHAELDARCRRLPRNHHVRHFWKGITKLSRPTGKEHSDIARILLGLIIDLPLPGGLSPVPLVKATRAMLDFLYQAQYPLHSTDTLAELHSALQSFHDNKHVFVALGIRKSWQLPKLHFISHYVALIKYMGTTDNFNTEYTERLHIDFAKNAYRATNHRDELPQMTLWLERREKVQEHERYIQWRLKGCPPVVSSELYPPPPPRITITKHPSRKAVSLDEIKTKYSAPYIVDAIARFVARYSNPTASNARIEALANEIDLPFRKMPVYHHAKFWLGDPQHHRLMSSEMDPVYAIPERTDKRGRILPGEFDTVLVNGGAGEYVGVAGYRVAQVKVIFSIPTQAIPLLFPSNNSPPRYLAYIEWFTPFPRSPQANHLLYRVKRSLLPTGERIASVIPLHNIRRSIQLFPVFGPIAPRHYTSSNVLDLCPAFYVNSFTDRHAYHTVK